MKHKRALIVIGICLLLCVVIVLYHGPGALLLRGYGGDVVVVVLIYFLLRLFSSAAAWKIGFVTFVFACIVETNQLWWYVFTQQSSVTTLVAGTTFDWFDLIAYAAGTACGMAVDKLMTHH